MNLDLHYFWSLDVNQYMKHVRVFNEQQKEQFKQQDLLNYILGKYIAFAFNDPKKYPESPLTHKDTNHSEMSDEEMERQALKNTIMMGGVVK
jgi:hypothetical protein